MKIAIVTSDNGPAPHREAVMATKTATKESGPTFNQIERMLFRDVDDPPPDTPLTDHRLVAGLLFTRWNDQSTRHLRIDAGKATLIIRFAGLWSPYANCEIPVDPAVVEKLREEHALEGTPEWGRTDMKKLRLTNHGKRRVLQEWVSGGTMHDFFEAGGSIELSSGQGHWPRDS